MIIKHSAQTDEVPTPGSDCKDSFRSAYENRYTWDEHFSGYQGRCFLEAGSRIAEGIFQVTPDLIPSISDISDEFIEKMFLSQLREVAIHRVRRSFKDTHKNNTFTVGDVNNIGTEIIVGGKCLGDRYRIKNNIITMVHRHIHGSLITIYTKEIIDTGNGYLSKSYTSQYSDPKTGKSVGALSYFTDTFVSLSDNGPWVLSERIIVQEPYQDTPGKNQTFRFQDMKPL